jgi:Zn-dependent protease
MFSVDALLSIVILILSVVMHEVSHGLMAYWLGDPTAKYADRLTLNPLKHLDPLGSVLLPFLLVVANSPVMFGWAKPVPYNPYNLRNQKYGPALVGAAGPLSNLLLAVVAGVAIRILLGLQVAENSGVYFVLALVIFINLMLMVFNLMPIPPLDGSKLLYAILPISENTKMMLDQYGIILVFLFIFLFSWVISAVFLLVLNIFSNTVMGGINILQYLN